MFQVTSSDPLAAMRRRMFCVSVVVVTWCDDVDAARLTAQTFELVSGCIAVGHQEIHFARFAIEDETHAASSRSTPGLALRSIGISDPDRL